MPIIIRRIMISLLKQKRTQNEVLLVSVYYTGVKFIAATLFIWHTFPATAQIRQIHNDLWEVPLEEVFQHIEKTFGKTILYSNDDIKGYIVTAKMNAYTAEDAVGTALNGKPFTYQNNGNYITISPKNQEYSETAVAGIVVDAKREALPYARLEIVSLTDNRRFAVATDKEGKFRISHEGCREFVLKASYVGKQSYTVVMKNPEQEMELGLLMLQDSVINLPEISITQNKMIIRADRYIIYPSREEREESHSGTDIIERLFHPGGNITITDVLLTEEKFAQMDIRINGRKATLYEVRALRSEDITYIEYLYNEPVYGYRPYAINLITKNRYGFSGEIEATVQCMPKAGVQEAGYKESDFSVYMQTVLPTQTWGLHYKMNHTRNEALRWDDRNKTISGMLTDCEHHVKVNGNISLGEKQHLQLSLADEIRIEPGSSMTRTGGEHIQKDGHSSQPSANALYTAHINKQHIIHAEFYGSMLFVRENYQYVQKSLTNADNPFSTGYGLKENIYTVKTEAGYGWEWLSKKKWSANAGINMAIHAYGNKIHTRMLPQLTARFVPRKEIGINYRLHTYTLTPDMLALSDAVLPIDRNRRLSGQSHLHPSTTWEQEIGCEFNKETFTAGISLNYEYTTSPQTTHTISTDGDKTLHYMWVNGKYSSDFYPKAGMSARILGKQLQMRLSYSWHRMAVSCRRSYYHQAEGELFGFSGHWKYGVAVQTSQRALQDELYIHLPDNHYIYANYTWHNLRIGASWQRLFSHHGKQKEITRCSNLEYTRHIISYGKRHGDIWINMLWRW